jgi:hypothetical protein
VFRVQRGRAVEAAGGATKRDRRGPAAGPR